MEASPFTQPRGGRCDHPLYTRTPLAVRHREVRDLACSHTAHRMRCGQWGGGSPGNSPRSLPAVAPAESHTQGSRPAEGEDGLGALTSNPHLRARRLGTAHGKGLCSPQPVALRSSGFFQGPGPARASLGTRVPPEAPGTCLLRAQVECSRGPRLSMSYMSLGPLTEQSRQEAPGSGPLHSLTHGTEPRAGHQGGSGLVGGAAAKHRVPGRTCRPTGPGPGAQGKVPLWIRPLPRSVLGGVRRAGTCRWWDSGSGQGTHAEWAGTRRLERDQ